MKKILLLSISLIWLAGCSNEVSFSPQLDTETLRSPASGEIVGFTSEYGAHVWRGIPFAEPPIGALRWRAPRSLKPNSQRREALDFSDACSQPPSSFSEGGSSSAVIGSEDCLYLNIYAPPMSGQEAQTAGLPVMFWIHGGGNSTGTTQSYDASALAMKENVIVITSQYRLGPLGWFYQPELAEDGDSDEDRSGNYGTLDLIQGLQWTRDNIGQFGGNANNVTIFGESAGGRNVFSLLVSPLAKGLFHRAISQSGSARAVPLDLATEGSENSSYMVSERLGKKTPSGQKNLRELGIQEILQAYGDTQSAGMIAMPTILRDGHVIPTEHALKLFEQGKYNQVPIIMGSNKDEQKLFQYLNPQYTSTWFGIWSRPIDRAIYQRDSKYHTEHWRLIGVQEPAKKISQSPVYTYRFDWDDLGSPLAMDLPFLLGAAHAIEIPFIFGDLGLEPIVELVDTSPRPDERKQLSEAMMTYWANFARTGSPNEAKSDLPEWPRWSQQSKTMVFDASSDGGIRMEADPSSPSKFAERFVNDTSFKNTQHQCDMMHNFISRAPFLEPYQQQVKCD